MARKHSIAQLYSPSLKHALAEYPGGTWVAVSHDQRIVGTGSTPARAERQAEASGAKPNLLLQVPIGGAASKPAHNGNGNSNGMNHARAAAMPLNLPSFYRGIYKRVAKKLGCDPSYVSRVARGERTSEMVSDALQAELSHAVLLMNKNAGKLRRKMV